MKMAISRLNHLIDLGVSELIDTDTIEGSTAQFASKRQLHCAFYQRSQNQQYELLGTKLEDTIVVAVRSQYRVDKSMLAQLDGDQSAGAKVLAEKLREATPRTNHKDVKYGHLQDNVMSQDTDINGEDNGNSTVGFGKKAYIARFLNDGTIKMGATHFVDNARRNATDEVFVAQQKVYEERLGDDS